MPPKKTGLLHTLREELLDLAANDQAVRARLAADGTLFTMGYHPEMQAVHDRNATRLIEILAEQGWPGRSLVGEDGASAAWLILQHAIGHPELQQRGLNLLRDAALADEVALDEVARLEDRIRIFAGRPQLYGTHFDWDEQGQMSPLPIEAPETLEERRASMGLPTLKDQLAVIRAAVRVDRETPPTAEQRRARELEFEEWARKVGWRNETPVG